MAQKKKRTGRPPLPPEQRQSERFSLKLTPGQARQLRALAASEGVEPGQYAYRVLVRHLNRKRR
jgi:hypothetical protein